jgi:hypothetical protein
MGILVGWIMIGFKNIIEKIVRMINVETKGHFF